MGFVEFLNPIMSPLLRMNPLWAIILISFLISLFITLIYKLVTDQKLMKELKDDLKAIQKEMKEFKNHPDKMLEIQKRAMDKNMKYMMQSMKSTFFTLIPILLIFGWLNAHFAYEPIMPGQEFSVDATFTNGASGDIILRNDELTFLTNNTQTIVDKKASWLLKGDAGGYVLEYEYNGHKYYQDLLITSEREYRRPVLKVGKDDLKELRIGNNPIKPLKIFGFELGWLWTYIIFSIAFSIGIRKILKVH